MAFLAQLHVMESHTLGKLKAVTENTRTSLQDSELLSPKAHKSMKVSSITEKFNRFTESFLRLTMAYLSRSMLATSSLISPKTKDWVM